MSSVENGVCLKCGSGVLDSGEHLRTCSAENDTRLVWLTREQRDVIDYLAATQVLESLVAAWDAAPADPAEAVLAAIREYIELSNGVVTLGVEGVLAPLVLAALGAPKATS